MEKFLFPIKSYVQITSPYGQRASTSSFHYGIDYGHCSLTTWQKVISNVANALCKLLGITYDGPNHDIMASNDGKIIGIRSNYNKTDSSGGSYGNYIKIDHGNGIHTLYAHLKYGSIKVKVGDTVKQRQVIAKMGKTGHSTGIHLHFEYRKNDKKIDPLPYLYLDKKTQAIGSNIIEGKYKINYLTLHYGTPVQRNENMNQIEVFGEEVRARSSAGIKEDNKLGIINKGIYNIDKSQQEGDYLWFEVEPSIWVAYSDKWANLYEVKIIEESKPIETEPMVDPPIITPIEKEITEPEIKPTLFQMIIKLVIEFFKFIMKGMKK